MRYRKGILVAAMLSALMGGPALWAQANGTLQGRITDPSGGPLPGAVVSVTGEGGSRTASADRTGSFRIPDLPPGNYRLSASLDAFASSEPRSIEIRAGQTLTENFRLASLPYSELVVVTAQKRPETLVEVPASVAVLGGDTLEQHRVEDLEDLAPLVSGLTVTTAEPGTTRLTLRGVNTGGVASTVGVYSDDVPFGSSSGLANAAILAGNFDTFDVARVEVLRGPQGSLYGASSLGGVLKYVMNQPTAAGFEARVMGTSETAADGGAGYSLKGMVNVPLGARFALRATGFYRSDDGFIDSIGNNPVSSLANPAVIIIDGTRVASNINTARSSGGRLSGLYTPSEKFSLLLTAQMQDIKSGAPNAVDADPVTLEPLQSGEVQSSYFEQPVETRYRISSATADWNLGAASVESVTSYATFEQRLHLDATIASGLTGGPPLASLVTAVFGNAATRPLSARLPQTTSTDKFSQELRLVSSENKTFEWLIGAYYTNEESSIRQEIFAVEAATGAVASGIPILADLSLPSEYKELAGFGNTTWHVTPRFDLSVGARLSSNEQVASQVADGPLVGGHTQFDNVESSESPFTYSIAPRYMLSANSSIYARLATGFRPGGPNVLPPDVPPDTPLTYKSDSLTSYEAGWKATGGGGRSSVDLSVFYLDWTDIQLLAVVNGFGINGNGGTATSKGAEFTASIIPAAGLTFSLNGAYTDAFLTKDTEPIVGGLDGDLLPYTPKWAAALRGDYEWSVRNVATAFVGGGISYTGDRTFDFTTRDDGGRLRTIESYVTADLRVGTEIGRLLIELYGKNLTNETGIATVGDAGALPNGALGLGFIRPRTIGLALGVRAW
jgi:outer membrane receptor protein involved in Fe transport